MSTIRNPVGPLPPEIYWRRRIVVGVVALAVLIIIVLIIVRPGSGAPAEQPTPDPQTTETAGPGDDSATGDAAACTPSQVTVTPVTDADAYPAAQQPLLSLTLLNTATTACTIEAGSDVQSYVITSGDDRIWASTDCQEPGIATEVTLEPGEPLTTTPFAWSRTRSSADDCAAERDPVIAGGATYRLSVSVGEFEGDADRPFILN